MTNIPYSMCSWTTLLLETVLQDFSVILKHSHQNYWNISFLGTTRATARVVPRKYMFSMFEYDGTYKYVIYSEKINVIIFITTMSVTTWMLWRHRIIKMSQQLITLDQYMMYLTKYNKTRFTSFLYYKTFKIKYIKNSNINVIIHISIISNTTST